MGADYSIADISCSAGCATSSAFTRARELVGFDRVLHVQAWLDRGPAVQRGLQVTVV